MEQDGQPHIAVRVVQAIESLATVRRLMADLNNYEAAATIREIEESLVSSVDRVVAEMRQEILEFGEDDQ